MIGNLTGGTDAESRDLAHVIYRMKMLGFNAIRLPFTFAALAKVCKHPLPVQLPLACSQDALGHRVLSAQAEISSSA